MIIGVYFSFKDLRRVIKDWFLIRFKISRLNLIKATFFNTNKRTLTKFLTMDDKGIISPGENASYNVNEARILYDTDGLPNAYFVVGNATQVDVYGEGKKTQSSAHLQDAAIKLAMTAAEFGPLHEFISFVRKWVPLFAIGIVAIAGLLGVLLFIVFDMAGNISANVGGTAILT